MDIPLNPTTSKDIYSYGFDAGLNRSIPDNSTGVVYDAVGDSLNTAQMLQGGNLILKTLSIGGLVKQVAPGDDIQAAIDAVSREGGGTVQLKSGTYKLFSPITIREKVILLGQGFATTILDFQGTVGGITGSDSNMTIAEFQVLNSGQVNGGIRITGGLYFVCQNVSVTGSTNAGIYLTNLSRFCLENTTSTGNTSHGIHVYTTGSLSIEASDTTTKNWRMWGVASRSNGGSGLYFESVDTGAQENFLIGASDFQSNTSHGVRDAGGGSGLKHGVFAACFAISNGGDGFGGGEGHNVVYIGCRSHSNTGYGYYNNSVTSSGVDSVSIGSTASNNTAGGFHTPFGLMLEHDGSPMTDFSSSVGNYILYDTEENNRRTLKMTNSSGTGLRAGNVVVRLVSNPGTSVTTTTTNGNNLVLGVCLSSITSAATGPILTEGKATGVYVANGTSSISIGDFLSAYSHAYYAKKAVTGDTAFAIALSAPTTGTAQIEALLISPRLI